MDVVEQFSVPPVAVAPGTVLDIPTTTVSRALHPPAPVTVRIYVPCAVTFGVKEEDANPAGPVQDAVAPCREDDPSRVTLVVEQVSILSAPAIASG